MGPNSRDYRGIREALTSWFASAIILAAVTSVINAVTDLDVGRTFILNPSFLTWEEASQRCRDMNGTLARIDAVYVIPEMGYKDEWTLWTGLRINSSQPTWEDGTRVNWTNWYGPFQWSEGDGATCVTAVTSSPFSWMTVPCNKTLPSLCEIPEGTCRFNATPHASLSSHNDKRVYMVKESCLELCRTTRELDCRSLEVSRYSNTCQLSTDSRWSHPNDFNVGDRNWDYYHWTCINGTYLGGIYVSPNGVELPSMVEATTTPPATTITTDVPTTTEEDEGDIVCFKRKPVTQNETEEVQEEVKQLQTLSVAYRKQSKMKKKISVSDTRPSATYVGSLAVGVVLAVLGLIVCSDLISTPRYIRQIHRKGTPCGRCAKRLKKKMLQKQSKIQFTEYSEQPPSVPGVGTLMVNARLPYNFRPERLGQDNDVEMTYFNRPEGTPNNGKLELHLERIRRLDKEFGRRKSLSSTGPSVVDDRKNSSFDTSSEVYSIDDLDENPNPEECYDTSFGTDARQQRGRLEVDDGHEDIGSNNPHEDNPDSESGIGGSNSSDGSQPEPTDLRNDIHIFRTADTRHRDDFADPEHDIELTNFDRLLENMDSGTTKDFSFSHLSGHGTVYQQGPQSCDSFRESKDNVLDTERSDPLVGQPECDHTGQAQPQVEIRIEEDDSPDQGPMSPPVFFQVNRNLLHVRESPLSMDGLDVQLPRNKNTSPNLVEKRT